MISFILICLFVILSALLLLYSTDAFLLAQTGLMLWLERMVPTLLPFMILSSVMTGLDLQTYLCRPFRKLNQKLFSVSENGTYCIFMGYLCGFPMGAFCASELCTTGRISKKTAQYLIAFCNNIGPIYFFSFALGMVGFHTPSFSEYILLGIGMYGIPFLYGILTAKTSSRHAIAHTVPTSCTSRNFCESAIDHDRTTASPVPETDSDFKDSPLFGALDHAISRSGNSILRLCGYMVFFNVLMLPFYRLFYDLPFTRIFHCFMEISGGLKMMQPLVQTPCFWMIGDYAVPLYPVFMLTALSFGGLSCIGQTSVFLQEAGLSVGSYVKSRTIIALCAGLYYTVCFASGILTL